MGPLVLSEGSHFPRELSRRHLLGAVAAGAISVGCARTSVHAPADAQGTPVVSVPGFDDPMRWAGRTFTVGAWGGEVQTALDEALWTPFAAATGCTVQPVRADYDQLRVAVDQSQPYADLVLVDSLWAETATDRGLIQPAPADFEVEDAIAAFGSQPAAIPAFAYALVSTYHRNAIPADAPPRGWAEWWDVDRFPGGRALGRDPLGALEFALMADGVAAADLYPLDLDRAFGRLDAIYDTIGDHWWVDGAEPVAWLGSERVDLSSAWHYRLVAGQRDGLAVDLVWDDGLLAVDHWVIPTGAVAPDIAADFLRFAFAAEAQAELARRVPLGPVNPDAFDWLDPVTAALVPTAPTNLPRLHRLNAGWWAANRESAVQQFEAWLTEVSGG